MASSEARERQADDEDEDLMEWEAPNYKDTCLWLIDNSESMHAVDPNTVDPETGKPKSYMNRTLEVACKMMEDKLIKSPSDRIGILLFNTRDYYVPVEGKKTTYARCYCVQPIATVGVPAVMDLRDDLANAAREEEPADFFKTKYPPDGGQMKIEQALSNAESMLNSAGKTGSRRVFFVTNVDDPYAGRSARIKFQKGVLEKVKDMRRRGIEFEAFFLPRAEQQFNVKAFYADIFQAYDDESEQMKWDQNLTGGNDISTVGRGSSWNAFEKFDDMEKDCDTKQTPKRVIFRLGMELSDGFVIGVAGYNLVSKANKGQPVKVFRPNEDEVWQEVVTQSHLQCQDTGKLLNPSTEVYHAFTLGFDMSQRSIVRFSPEEILKLKTSGMKPTIKVLGFKDRSSLSFWENVKHSVFIYPSDAEYIGSQRAFAALLKVMLKKDKIAIAVVMSRPTSIPEFVAVYPQAEVRSREDGSQLEPPGMHLIPLPFADDIRDMPGEYSATLEAEQDQVDLAARIIKAYGRKKPFNPDWYPNPALEHHYAALKAVAFGIDLKEPEDKTIPKYSHIEERAGRLVERWAQSSSEDERVKNRQGPPLPIGVIVSDQKRPMVYDAKEEEDFCKLHVKGSLDKKTNDALKAALDFYRLPKTGKKAELVERVGRQLDKVLARKQGEGK